jgi:hypothetical protein
MVVRSGRIAGDASGVDDGLRRAAQSPIVTLLDAQIDERTADHGSVGADHATSALARDFPTAGPDSPLDRNCRDLLASGREGEDALKVTMPIAHRSTAASTSIA